MKADDKKDTGKSESAKETQGGYTKQQLAFIEGKKVLHNYEEIMKTRPLTEEERHNVARVKSMLLKKIFRYGMKLANDTMHKYRIPLDAYKDVQAEIALAFSEKLKDYDPYRAAPTTFFKPYFQSVISDYVRENSQHLSQYDATNIAKVRKAKYYFMTKGVTANEEMICNRTGLSLKVVKQTLRLEANSIYADVDDMISLKSDIPTPDQALFEKERRDDIFSEVHRLLSPQEFRILEMRLDLDGDTDKPIPYQEIADKLDMNVRAVKQIWSGVIAKLGNSKKLQFYRKGVRPYEEIDSAIDYHSSVADELNGIFEGLGFKKEDSD